MEVWKLRHKRLNCTVMQSETARISTDSRQRALDWSLVLASQGIEATISPPGSGNGWELWVPTRDYDRARVALRQYHMENRPQPWRQEVLRPGLLFDWGALAWVFLAILFHALDSRRDLRFVGRMDSTGLAAGDWWRLFTAEWLHGDLGHLAANLSIGLVLLGLVMGCYGTGVGLLAAYLAGAGGNLFSWLLSRPPYQSLGASGMVMGCVGLLAGYSFSHLQPNFAGPKLALGGLVGGVMLFILFGLAPQTDVLAHLGGFLSGILGSLLLSRSPCVSRSTKINLACGFLFAALAIIPWWLALSHAATVVKR